LFLLYDTTIHKGKNPNRKLKCLLKNNKSKKLKKNENGLVANSRKKIQKQMINKIFNIPVDV